MRVVDACDSVGGMSSPFAALVPLIDRQFACFGRETPLPGVRLSRAEAPGGPIHSVYGPSLGVVVQGAKISVLGDRSFRYGTGQGLVAGIDVPVTAYIIEASSARPYLAISVSIDAAMVADLRQAPTDIGDQMADGSTAALATADLDIALCDPLARLLALLDRPRDMAVLAPLIRREIVWLLLCGPLGATLRRFGPGDGHAARIARATAWIRDHYAEPLRVADLAMLAHMSVPSFHRHFRAVTASTPVAFQKQVRLEAARRLLTGDLSVAAVGYATGYDSPSQFSRDYRRRFGLSPRDDAAAFRAAAAG